MPFFHPPHLPIPIAAIVLATSVAGAAYAAKALTVSGAVSAAVLGAIIFGLGGWRDAAALLAFFLTSSALSRWRRRNKEVLGFEKTGRRDAAQVWANGGVAAACVLAPRLAPGLPTVQAHLAFLAALGAANADTWATEIGAALGGTPFLLTTGRRVAPGVSGAVSGPGLLAALSGAALLGAFTGGGAFLVVTISGWAGALFDSLLGATVQAQWRDAAGRWTETPQPSAPARGLRGMNNDRVNLLCTLSAAALAAWVSA